MKTNDYLIAIATLCYTWLFFEQSAGINFFIFSILLTGLCFYRNRTLLQHRSWIASATGSILSGFAVFYYGTSFSQAASIISLLLLAAVSFNAEGSLFVSAANSMYSYLMTIPSAIVHVFSRDKENSEGSNLKFRKILLLVLPMLVSIIFFFLYREANPLFEEVTDKINLDFISVDWMLFTFFGFLLMYGFFYQSMMKKLSEADSKSSNKLSFVSEEEHQHSYIASLISSSSEMFTGMALFALLNLLLFAVNSIDVYYLYIIQKLPDHLTLSEYLHDGTNALIVSILFAIGIILFFFRGRLNFMSENRTIRWLCYGWVLQNIVLILSTANRNWYYISNFGLTHKRLGVYVFLVLCIVGLVTSLAKVAKVKSNWFLFRKNSWAVYASLVFASLVNWDAVIASYNLSLAYSKNVKPDTQYLGRLCYTAMPVLLYYYELEKQGKTKATFYDGYLKGVIAANSNHILTEAAQKEWQSSCLIKMRVVKQIESIYKSGLTMNLR